MEFLLWFDRFLLRKIEAFAHFIQRMTGRDNFWLGWLAFWLRISCDLWNTYTDSYRKGTVHLMIGIGTSLLIGMFTQYVIIRLLSLHSSVRGQGSVHMRNLLEVSPSGRFVRLTMITIFLYSCTLETVDESGRLRMAAVHLCMVVAWYLFSCTPLPPGERREKSVGILQRLLLPSTQ